ncbi:BTAD domain-containing putative transcriptional regulator [Streptomyces sp. NPDC102406]|uniref:AfsR/SARP family transcriptional regulator n=1 Tax=Streptomyces sp. NPDC102406 TaxID=3366171 RepID=UPI00380283EC
MGAEGTSGVHFSVLGRLRAHRDGAELDLGSPQQRAVAAILILRHDRAVSIDELVRALWDRIPRRPETVIRTYIWRLRHLLEPARAQGEPWQLLVSVPGGYSLRLADGCLDWALFERRVAEARVLTANGDIAAARRLFDTALELWPEVALMGVPGPFAEAERSRLEEHRLDVVEARLEAMVELGECADAATELVPLIEGHTLREGLHYLLMRALYRTGRQGEALAAYRRVHRVLAEELGIEPNPRLQELHAEILDATTPSVRQVVSRQERAPRQIPHAVADFTGRVEETERIRETLLHPSAEAMPIVLVTGMGGAGKTSLVMHSIQTVLAAYPDGQLYADLRGADGTPADPGVVLASFLRALGERDSFIPADLDERAALYRSTLAQRRVLIVLDNAADMEQVIPLLPGAGTCAVVITSRNGLATLPVSLRLHVGALPWEEAMHLFTRLVGAARVAAESPTAHRILTACGGLPLAVRIIGSRLAARPAWTLSELAERLADEQHRLSELRVDSVTVESSFALGYGQLDQATCRALRILALPAHGVYDLQTAGAVLDAPVSATQALMERLVGVGLLESPALDRYRYHDLVRLFARRLALETDPEQVRHAALARLLHLHIVTATEAYRVMRPGHSLTQTALPVVPGGAHFNSVGEALAWSASVLDDIFLLLRQTAVSHTESATTLLLMLDPVLESSYLWHQVVPVASLLADAAAHAQDKRAEGRARYMLSGALAQVSRLDEALEHADRALQLASRDDDVYAMSLNVQAFIVSFSDSAAAIPLLRKAAALAREQGNFSTEATALGNMVQIRVRSEDVDEQTVADSERQVRLFSQLGDRYGEAFAAFRQGQVLILRGRPNDAISAHQHVLALTEEGEHGFVRAGSLMRLGEAFLQTGEQRIALRYAEDGLLLSRKVRHEHLEALSLRTLGDVKSAMNRPDEAISHWRESLAILEAQGARLMADTLLKRLADSSPDFSPPSTA